MNLYIEGDGPDTEHVEDAPRWPWPTITVMTNDEHVSALTEDDRRWLVEWAKGVAGYSYDPDLHLHYFYVRLASATHFALTERLRTAKRPTPDATAFDNVIKFCPRKPR